MSTSKRLLTLMLVLTFSSLSVQAVSLWPEHGAVSLFTDNKAYRIGDIVTVIVEEQSKVSTSAGSSLSKTTNTEGEVETLEWPHAPSPLSDDLLKAAWGSKRTFAGDGSYELEDRMETRLTAVVIEVLPNGNLVIEGSRLRQTVDEKITMRISGIVRPEDIGTDNTVPSSSVAQGKIVFDSAGPIARSSKRGFFNRLVDFIWPF